MPIDCEHKRRFGREACWSACLATEQGGPCTFVRVEGDTEVPASEPRFIDVAVLDMNHGWPNLGHDSTLRAIHDAACDLAPHLLPRGLAVRVISFEVRRDLRIPEPPNGRFSVYVGTGGPGHLDPRLNDGSSPGAQGIRENPAWERPLFDLFEAIRVDESAALVAVCHTFGLMCRWLGIADPVLRGPDKGGKSAGILENILTDEALVHPWFARLSRQVPEGRRIRILDSRLYDLIPVPARFPDGATAIGYETLGVGGPRGEAVTMLEIARDRDGVMPRVFASNHHPEVVNAFQLFQILHRKYKRGEVPHEWFEERRKTLEESLPDEKTERRLHLTSDFTVLGPIRFHLHRQVRRRLESMGIEPAFHERDVVADVDRALSGRLG